MGCADGILPHVSAILFATGQDGDEARLFADWHFIRAEKD
jgi:hypothetical protein